MGDLEFLEIAAKMVRLDLVDCQVIKGLQDFLVEWDHLVDQVSAAKKDVVSRDLKDHKDDPGIKDVLVALERMANLVRWVGQVHRDHQDYLAVQEAMANLGDQDPLDGPVMMQHTVLVHQEAEFI